MSFQVFKSYISTILILCIDVVFTFSIWLQFSVVYRRRLSSGFNFLIKWSLQHALKILAFSFILRKEKMLNISFTNVFRDFFSYSGCRIHCLWILNYSLKDGPGLSNMLLMAISKDNYKITSFKINGWSQFSNLKSLPSII